MEAVTKALELGPLPEPKWRHLDEVGVRLAGLTVLSDWIASNDKLYVAPATMVGNATHYLDAARGSARRAVDAIGLRPVAARGSARPPARWAELWQTRTPPRPVQQRIIELLDEGRVAPGLAILEAPMGLGKTEAAIFIAEHWNRARGMDGIFFALPTQATSNQMFRRYRAFLRERGDGADARLVHGMAWLIDDRAVAARVSADAGGETGEWLPDRVEAAAWFGNARRALLAPHAVGTIDQVLMAALRVRFGSLRWLGLGNKVLVVDEVHAYDAYMRRRLRRVLEWCRALGIPVVLLSATLPSWQREELLKAYGATMTSLPDGRAESLPYPVLTALPLSDDIVSTHGFGTPAASVAVAASLEPGLMALEDEAAVARVTELALQATVNGGCACILLNTVSHAQLVHRRLLNALRDAQTECDVTMFHARFPAWRRAELEAQVEARFGERGDRPRRAILIATQVVEQSLDVDFDVLLTQLAPMDLMLQRLGRVWRHARPVPRPTGAEPRIVVLGPQPERLHETLGPSRRVYTSLSLLRSYGLLAGRPRIEIPGEIRSLVEAAYDQQNGPLDAVPAELLLSAAEEEVERRRADENAAGMHMIGAPDPMSFRYPAQEMVEEAIDDEPPDRRHASTRLDDGYATAVLLLAREQDQRAWERALAGNASEGASLMACRVSLPAWWLEKCPEQVRRAQDAPLAPPWMRRLPAVTPLPTSDSGRPTITYSDVAGVALDAPLTSTDAEPSALTSRL
jgi:CRISPR-associated endonuclease/helicase Cas3